MKAFFLVGGRSHNEAYGFLEAISDRQDLEIVEIIDRGDHLAVCFYGETVEIEKVKESIQQKMKSFIKPETIRTLHFSDPHRQLIQGIFSQKFDEAKEAVLVFETADLYEFLKTANLLLSLGITCVDLRISRGPEAVCLLVLTAVKTDLEAVKSGLSGDLQMKIKVFQVNGTQLNNIF